MRIGVVAIGRNEGQRLRCCLQSIVPSGVPVVYVDSGSTDDSARVAHEFGALVVNLDLSIPFTAARARNAGFARLLEAFPNIEFVQFVDGDCEMVHGWLDRAADFTRSRLRAAVICGRRRELHPETSVYNRLCDIEWNTPIGLAKACGGDALIRVQALQEVNGYNPALIAGEEPDLCFRLRQLGWEVWRIDAEMTLHDAAMTRFSQWWKRNVRAGHAYAEAYYLHGKSPGGPAIGAVASNVLWSMPLFWPAWPLLWWRIYGRQRDAGYSTFVVIGKVPQCQGQLRFWMGRLLGKRSTLVEYK